MQPQTGIRISISSERQADQRGLQGTLYRSLRG